MEHILDIANDSKEKKIQSELKKKLNGHIKVPTPVGYIDLLTETEIIEIKSYANWTSAFGQILAYAEFYPDRNKCIYLFDVPVGANMKYVKKKCNEYGISVKIV
jgi:hypothetical protein